jgi:quercetin dioxygenase-like cupin family protein
MVGKSWLPMMGLWFLTAVLAVAWMVLGPTSLARDARHSPTHVLVAAQGPGATVRPRPEIKPVSSQDLTGMPGKKLTTLIVDFPPGGLSPAHHHGGSVYVHVLSGTIRSQLAGAPPVVYQAGDSFFEPMGITHLFAENMSTTERARALAVIVHDEGAVLTTYH